MWFNHGPGCGNARIRRLRVDRGLDGRDRNRWRVGNGRRDGKRRPGHHWRRERCRRRANRRSRRCRGRGWRGFGRCDWRPRGRRRHWSRGRRWRWCGGAHRAGGGATGGHAGGGGTTATGGAGGSFGGAGGAPHVTPSAATSVPAMYGNTVTNPGKMTTHVMYPVYYYATNFSSPFPPPNVPKAGHADDEVMQCLHSARL